MPIVTRFAPSPTGFLHIGGARTALFNWLFSKHLGGKCLLRIEDTDRARSTKEAVDAIFQGLKWLNLTFDDEPVFQFARSARHAEIAHKMVKEGSAYYCYCSQEELEKMRNDANSLGKSPKYNGKCRNICETLHNHPVVRIKANQDGATQICDLVQGEVTVSNSELDDMILLRSDGTPTYMLSVVVDDHDMGVTHVIRGDDHLTNTFRQIQIYKAMGWEVPTYAHIPLIHGPDGAKLSKRHGATSVMGYKDMGFLSDAISNYLLRLGWGHGDDEIISRSQAIEWFDIKNVGASPSRFDFAKLTHLNGHYIREADNAFLIEEMQYFCKYSNEEISVLQKAMDGLKVRAKTVLELVELAKLFFEYEPQLIDQDFLEYAKKLCVEFECAGDCKWLDDEMVANCETMDKKNFEKVTGDGEGIKNAVKWEIASLEGFLQKFALDAGMKFGKIAGPLRQIISGMKISPSVIDVMYALGRGEVAKRLRKSISKTDK